MPTNLLHHGPQNRAEKSAQNMAAIEGPRQYVYCSGIVDAIDAVEEVFRQMAAISRFGLQKSLRSASARLTASGIIGDPTQFSLS